MAVNSPDPGQRLEEQNSFASDQETVAVKHDLSDTTIVATTMSDLDDNISVTSTVYPDEAEDYEYEVDDILSEEVNVEGVMRYLVRWKDYPLDMCTWEPKENFAPELLEDIWEQKKRQPGFQPFDRRLVDEAHRAKALRHRNRNRKRRRLGLPETPPFLEAMHWTPDNEISDIELTADAATVVVGGTPPVAEAGPAESADPADPADLASTEIHDSFDEIMVIESLSAPLMSKKKNKKKKKRESIDLTREDLDPPGTKNNSEEKSKGKPAPRDETKKRKAPAEAAPDQSKNMSESPHRRRESADALPAVPSLEPVSSTAKSTSMVSGKHPEGKLPVKRASIDRPGKPAAPTPNTSLPKIRPATSKYRNGSLFDKPVERPSKPASVSASASKDAPTAKKTGPVPQPRVSLQRRQGQHRKIPAEMHLAVLFEKRSRLRRAELCERDKADRAIDPSQLKTALFPISKGPPASSTYTSPSELSPTEPAMVSQHAPLRPSIKRPASGDVFIRRRKSVRFSDKDGSDTGLLLGRTRLKSPPVAKSDGTDRSYADEGTPMYFESQEMEEPRAPQSLPPVPVKLLFGTQKEPVDAKLDVVAENSGNQQLLDLIVAGKTLRFDCSFLAATLLQQLNGIRKANLFSGNVRHSSDFSSSTTSSASVLQTVSQRLKLMASGLILVEPEHAIVVYPTNCEHWQESLFGFPTPPTPAASTDASTGTDTDPAVALRYVVFSTYVDCAALIRPSGKPGAMPRPLSDGQDRRQVMERFFHLSRSSFLDLLPDEDDKRKDHTRFFLAFPPTAKPFMYQMALWLREMDADCVVLFSTQAGSWMSFMRDVEQLGHPGVVIVHELVTGAVRRFPVFKRLVYPGAWNCRVWSISQATYASPIFYPVMQGLMNGDGKDDTASGAVSSSEIGRISWTELFPRGLALLLTPSVILADPMYVYNILRWVSAAARSGTAPVTLVAAWDLCSHLKEVADEKMRMCQDILGRQPGHFSKSGTYRATSRVGAAERHCIYRHEAWVLASELCDSRTERMLAAMRGPEWPSAVVLADPAIDPNDEQSLVNWFGWWSTLYMDQYRAFYVVGSESKSPELDLMSRRIRVPHFVNKIMPGSDSARAGSRMPISLAEEMRQKNATSFTPLTPLTPLRPPPSQSIAADPRREQRQRTDTITSASSAPVSHRHPSQPITAYSSQLRSYNHADNFWKVFGFIVWWRDAGEAFSHGFVDSSYNTIRAWFSYTWPFSMAHRSYIGLFNMVDDYAEASHAWLVVWRPVNPHIPSRTKSQTELIFWDPRARDRFDGAEQLSEMRGLTLGQQAVVEYVRKHVKEKNPGKTLEQVWINSHARSWKRGTLSSDCDTMQECFGFLEQLAGSFMYVMPPTGPHLKSLGYTKLAKAGRDTEASTPTPTPTVESSSTSTPSTTGRGQGQGQEPADVDMDDKMDDAQKTRDRAVPERMVFCPPRGSTGRPPYPNSLFESTRILKKRNPGATEMNYEFQPTKKWYREQATEGSGFDHVHVETVSEVCRVFRIPKAGDEV